MSKAFARARLLALLVLFASPLSAADLPKALTRSIAAGNQDWIDGLKSRDALRIAATYDDEAINCSATGQCVNGRPAIEQQMKTRVGSMAAVADAWVHSASTVLEGDLAYEWGSAGFRFADGKEFSGRYMTVWRRQRDGSWKIFRNLSLPKP